MGRYVFLLVILLLIADTIRDGYQGDRYELTLIDRVAISRPDPTFKGSKEFGRLQLVDSGSLVVPRVEKAAVRDPFIVGTTESGFFLFDTRELPESAQEFTNVADWRDALSAAGIADTEASLASPDTLAATRPAMQVRPWNFRQFGGPLGLSDKAWWGLEQIASFSIAFALGRWVLRSRIEIFIVSLLGAIGMMIGMMFDGGTGSCCAIGFTPLFYFAATFRRPDLNRATSEPSPA